MARIGLLIDGDNQTVYIDGERRDDVEYLALICEAGKPAQARVIFGVQEAGADADVELDDSPRAAPGPLVGARSEHAVTISRQLARDWGLLAGVDTAHASH